MKKFEIECGEVRGRIEARTAGAGFRKLLTQFKKPALSRLARFRRVDISDVWHYQKPEFLERSLCILALAVAALLALPADALAAKRACLTLDEVQERYPGRHAKYRSVHGFKCWFVGRTPAKSQFDVSGRRKAATKSHGGVESRSAGCAVVGAMSGSEREADSSRAVPLDGSGRHNAGIAPCPSFGVAPGPRDTDARANGGVEVTASGKNRAVMEPPSRLVDGRTSTATDDHGRDFAGGREPGTISADGVDEVLRILCPRGCLEARGKINPRTPQWQNMSSAAGMIMLRERLNTMQDEPAPVPVRTISYKRRP